MSIFYVYIIYYIYCFFKQYVYLHHVALSVFRGLNLNFPNWNQAVEKTHGLLDNNQHLNCPTDPEVKARCCHSAQRQTTQRCVSLRILDSVSRPQWWLQSNRPCKTSTTRWINGSHRGPGWSSSNPPTFLGHSSPRNPIKTGGKALYSSQGQTDSHHNPAPSLPLIRQSCRYFFLTFCPKNSGWKKKIGRSFHLSHDGNPSSKPDKALHFRAHLIKLCSLFSEVSHHSQESVVPRLKGAKGRQASIKVNHFTRLLGATSKWTRYMALEPTKS